jgi:hypothetical protein
MKHRWYGNRVCWCSAAAAVQATRGMPLATRRCRHPACCSSRSHMPPCCVLAVTSRPGFQQSITAVALAEVCGVRVASSRHAGAVDRDPWLMELIGHRAAAARVGVTLSGLSIRVRGSLLKRALRCSRSFWQGKSLAVAPRSPRRLPDPPPCSPVVRQQGHLFTTAAPLAVDDSARLSVHSTSYLPRRVALRRTDHVAPALKSPKPSHLRDVDATGRDVQPPGPRARCQERRLAPDHRPRRTTIN